MKNLMRSIRLVLSKVWFEIVSLYEVTLMQVESIVEKVKELFRAK